MTKPIHMYVTRIIMLGRREFGKNVIYRDAYEKGSLASVHKLHTRFIFFI